MKANRFGNEHQLSKSSRTCHPNRPGPTMQYIKPYTYFVQKEGGTNNLFMGSLCMLSTQIIPIVGQIVLMGYQAEVAEDLEKDPDISDHANFNFNHFSRYLGRGVWVFLIQLILAGLILLGLILSGGVGFATYSGIQGDVGIYVGIGVGFLCYIAFTIMVTMFTWPMTLHVQLSRGFHFGSALQFSMSFIKKLSGQLFISLLAHMFISSALMMAGMLVFCIGIFPAATISLMAQEHFMIQLYRIYLDEGGDPIGSESKQLEFDEE